MCHSEEFAFEDTFDQLNAQLSPLSNAQVWLIKTLLVPQSGLDCLLPIAVWLHQVLIAYIGFQQVIESLHPEGITQATLELFSVQQLGMLVAQELHVNVDQ